MKQLSSTARAGTTRRSRAQKTIELEPSFIYAHIVIGACESARGRYAEAIRRFRLVEEQAAEGGRGRLGHALARAGDLAEVILYTDMIGPQAGRTPHETINQGFRSSFRAGLLQNCC